MSQSIILWKCVVCVVINVVWLGSQFYSPVPDVVYICPLNNREHDHLSGLCYWEWNIVLPLKYSMIKQPRDEENIKRMCVKKNERTKSKHKGEWNKDKMNLWIYFFVFYVFLCCCFFVIFLCLVFFRKREKGSSTIATFRHEQSSSGKAWPRNERK